MRNARIRKEALERIGYGYTRQMVFDELAMAHPEVKPKKIADVVRFLPTHEARQHYRGQHQLLLVVIVLYGLLRVLPPLLHPDFSWELSYRLVSLAPIATLMVGYSIYRWQGQVFAWVGWGNLFSGFGIIAGLSALVQGEGDRMELALNALSFTTGVLALYLYFRVFSKYRMEKDPLGVIPPRAVFPMDLRMMPM